MANLESIKSLAKQFETRGDVHWYERDNGTTYQVQVRQLDDASALFVREVFGGRIHRRTRTSGYDYYVSGKEADDFLLAILPWLVMAKDMVSLVCEVRKEVRGRQGQEVKESDKVFRYTAMQEIQKARVDLTLKRGKPLSDAMKRRSREGS